MQTGKSISTVQMLSTLIIYAQQIRSLKNRAFEI